MLLGSIGLVAVGAAVESVPAAAAPGSKPWSWIGPDGEALPFATEEEALDFLRRAKVVDKTRLSIGIHGILKVRLEHNGVGAHAAFRTADERLKRVTLQGRFYPEFHDSYIYEVVAYRLSRLLGIDNVPPCVRRTLGGEPGSLQFWLENATNEMERRDKQLDPPDNLRWARQRQTMRLFDALIYNIDRNAGNMLIDPQWKLWFIDHTRAFGTSKEISTLTAARPIIWCERGLWERLQALDKSALRRHLKGLLGPGQIPALLERRDKLVARIGELIETRGEDAVFFVRSEKGSQVGDEDREALGQEDVPKPPSEPEEVPNL